MRNAEFETRPAHLKGQLGKQMHHEYCEANPDGFASIEAAFVELHGQATVIGSIRSDKLQGELREAFVEFHRSRTEDYGLCRMVTTCEHNRLTREHAGATQE